MAECLGMITVMQGGKFKKVLDGRQGFITPVSFHKVPCGKCANCLKSRRESWMFRIFHEIKNQEMPGYFLTFTYHPKYVRRVAGKLSLRFRDVQKFFKRLRKAGYYAKYICVGEYGGETFRPHYHLLLWTSAPVEVIEKQWFLGLIHWGQITIASAMYCLKYIIQPKPDRSVYHERLGRLVEVEKPRAQFSRGLGLSYLDGSVYEWHTSDYNDPVVYSYIDGKKVALPRYYRNKIFTSDQMFKNGQRQKWKSVKERRMAMRALLRKGIKGASTYIDRMRVEEANRFLAKMKFNQKL